MLPNGHLGLELICFDLFPQARLQNERDGIFLLSYDFATKETSEIVDGPLPSIRALRNYAWNQEMTIGVHATTDGLSGTLFWIYPEGYLPMDVLLAQDNKAWNMAEPFSSPTEIRGIAKSPAWSPNNEQFVFFGAVFNESTYGIAKIGANLSLFLMSPNTQPVELRQGFVAPSGTKWSPNGDWIAFSSQTTYYSESPSAEKLWLYSIQTDKLIEIGVGRHDALIWDPSGRFIVAMACPLSDESCSSTELRMYDVGEVTNPN